MLLLLAAAALATPAVTAHGLDLPDPHRWLEHHKRQRVVDWWTPRDAETRTWTAEGAAALGPWLEAHRVEEEPRPYLRDHRSGTSVWGLTDRQPADDDDDERPPYHHRVFAQGPDDPFPGTELAPLDDDPERAVCACMLAPDGRYLALGRLDPEDPDDEKAPRDCDIHVHDLDAGTSWPLVAAKWAGVSWRWDAERLVVTSAPQKRRAVIETMARDGSDRRELFRHKRYLTPGWLPDGRIVAIGRALARGGRKDWRVLHGTPVDGLSWLRSGLKVPWFAQAGWVGITDDEVLVRTTARGGAEVVRVELDSPSRWDWHSLVAERPGMSLAGARKHGDDLLVSWKRDGLARLEVQPYDGGPSRVVDLGGPWTNIWIMRGSSGAVVGANSPVARAWWARGADGTLTRLDGSWSDPDLVFEQVLAEADDGEMVPVSLVRRADAAPDGSAPVWLRVYGGFGHAQQAWLGPRDHAFLAAGGMVATVHARGGDERGERWHEAAISPHLDRTFDDVIAAAEGLIAAGWTAPRRLVLSGGSNGGLTTAATVAKRPELFGAAVAVAGVMDLVRAPRFGKWWPDEYGRLRDDEQRPHLVAQSPLHRTPAGPLPPTLLITGERDDVVSPAHTYKLMAAWEALEGGPVLLRVDRFGTHGGDPVGKAEYTWRDHDAASAETLAFVFRALELELPSADAPGEPPSSMPNPDVAPVWDMGAR